MPRRCKGDVGEVHEIFNLEQYGRGDMNLKSNDCVWLKSEQVTGFGQRSMLPMLEPGMLMEFGKKLVKSRIVAGQC